MKKYLIIFLCAVILPISTVAQDKLCTMDGECFSVSVKEITDKIISYKKWENPNGPTYKMKRSFVARIEYKNGTIEYYAQKPPKKVEQAPVVEQPPVVQASPKESVEKTPVAQPQTQAVQEPVVQTVPPQPTPVKEERVVMHKGKLYFATGRQLNEYEQRIYFGRMFEEYERQQNKYVWGLSLTWAAAIVSTVGTITTICLPDNPGPSIACLSVGVISLSVGIPLLVIGDKKRKQIFQDRAAQGGYVAPTAELTFGSQHYGVGFAIKF